MTAGSRVALIAVALALAGCASNASSTVTHARSGSGAPTTSIGVSVPPVPVEVAGARGTAELRVQDPARPKAPGLFVALVRGVPRALRDVCFATYTANESPEDGDVGCQVRGRGPL